MRVDGLVVHVGFQDKARFSVFCLNGKERVGDKKLFLAVNLVGNPQGVI